MVRFLLDEHVSRVFERLLQERGHTAEQAKDRFGERTDDLALLKWCNEHGAVIVSNNAQDFTALHERQAHAGIFIYRQQDLLDEDPKGVAQAVDRIVVQYGIDGIGNELVELDEWYAWPHE